MTPLNVMAFAVFFAASAPPAAETHTAPDAVTLTHERDALRALNAEHLRIVRRAANLCAGPSTSSAGRINSLADFACVMSLTDKAVAESGNSQLQAYHAALPQPARYDQDRSATYWMRMVVRE